MLTHRPAVHADIPLLAQLNRQLVEDEGDSRRFTVEALTTFWERWLEDDYQAVIFEKEAGVAAYALYRFDEEAIYLRQFFVCRECRRQGIGREAMRQLRQEVWPPGERIALEVLIGNERGLRFWRSQGFEDHALLLLHDNR